MSSLSTGKGPLNNRKKGLLLSNILNRSVGRTLASWCDVRKRAGKDWIQKAGKRALRCSLGEACMQ